MKPFFTCFLSIIICTFHVVKGDTDAVQIPISKDQTTSQYIAKLQQGTPPNPIFLTVDLGGPFSWVDCSRGYRSSTYSPAQCGLAPCASFGPEQTCNKKNICSVIATNPITGKSVAGDVGTDILTVLTTDVSSPAPPVTAHVDFVCAASSLVQGLSKGVNGIVGFGRSRSSLLTQFDNEFSDEVSFFPLQFTICLSHSTGFAIFGKANDQSKLLTFTPMIRNPKGTRVTDYYLNVTAIKINGKQVNLNTSLLSIDDQGNGGTKISTVHPYTVLETSIFKAVSIVFTKQLKGVKKAQPVSPFGACYESKGGLAVVPVIDLVLHNKNVHWTIFGANSMVQVDKNVACLGFVEGGVKSRAAIVIGGHQLEDNVVQFGVVDGIGFSSSLLSKSTSCANFNLSTLP